MNKKKILAWSFFLLLLLLIFCFSSQSGEESSHLSGGLIEFLESLTHIPLSSEIVSFMIRKLAHFTEYAILGILTMNLGKQYGSIHKKQFFFILLFCVFYAFTDEFHQIFIANRSGNFWDVSIDSLGSFFGMISYLLFSKKQI